MCEIFPELLSFLYYSKDNIAVDQQEEIEEFCPETCNNLLIANKSFENIMPNLGITRRHGRFGFHHVHVMQFSGLAGRNSVQLLKRLRSLSHPNFLKLFYVTESPSKM